MLAIRLPKDIEDRLAKLAQATQRTKTFYATQAILEHLDDLEDAYLAEQRLLECHDTPGLTTPARKPRGQL